MKKYLILVSVIGLMVTACASKQSSPLTGTWKLTAYGPKETPTPAVTGAEATLTFDDEGNVTGNGGCNSLGGKYNVDGNKINFSDITSTLMACDDARMAQESAVTKVLSGSVEYEIKDNMLTLTSGDSVLIFSATK